MLANVLAVGCLDADDQDRPLVSIYTIYYNSASVIVYALFVVTTKGSADLLQLSQQDAYHYSFICLCRC